MSRYLAIGRLAASGDWFCFTGLSNVH